MSSIVEEKQLSQVTIEILERTKKLKERTKENMLIGENDIIKGITMFEEVVKELNPSTIDDNIVSMIIGYVNIVLFRQEEKNQRVNSKVNLGINNCYFVIDNYNKYIKREKNRNVLVKTFN